MAVLLNFSVSVQKTGFTNRYIGGYFRVIWLKIQIRMAVLSHVDLRAVQVFLRTVAAFQAYSNNENGYGHLPWVGKGNKSLRIPLLIPRVRDVSSREHSLEA